MKFHQLPIGARFEFRGTAYRKLDNLKASPEDGGKTSLVPRSAEVKSLFEQDHQREKADADLDPAQALAQLYRHCEQRLESLRDGADPGQIAEFRQSLEDLYQTLRS